MDEPQTETILVEHLMGNIYSIFGPDSLVATEVRTHGRAFGDIVLVLGSGEVVVVEAKLRDWRRVVGQAFLNRCCADRSYLAMWHTRLEGPVVAEAEDYGIGIVSIGPQTTILRQAPPCTPEQGLRSTVHERVRNILGGST